jgi:Putative peptidoglycan binding domain/D-alanyl-D-alanine carboxypeptidase
MSNLTNLVAVPTGINIGLNGTNNALMSSLLGNPRGGYDQECRDVTNTKLKSRMKTADFGPFNATGLDKAVDSLAAIMGDIKIEQRAVFDVLSTAGMLCCRNVRGSTTAISNHSWGTAIDLKVAGILDQRGNNKVQVGLTLIAPIFNRHQWYWGAGFPTEDGMHFEVSKQLLTSWEAASPSMPDDNRLMSGDRGTKVAEMQARLNALGENLTVDGVFGTGTRAAVFAFQAQNGLEVDGIADPATLAKLGLLQTV